MASISLDHHRLELGMLEDDMEISSDRGHDVGDFIDIDHDLEEDENVDSMIDDDQEAEENGDTVEYTNDEYMSDDNEDKILLESATAMDDDLNLEDAELDDASNFDTDNIDVVDAYDAGLGAIRSDQGILSNISDPQFDVTANATTEQPYFAASEENGRNIDDVDQAQEQSEHNEEVQQQNIDSTHNAPERSAPDITDDRRNASNSPVSSSIDGRETLPSNGGGLDEVTPVSSKSIIYHARGPVEGVMQPALTGDLTEVEEVDNVEENFLAAGLSTDVLIHPVMVVWEGVPMHLFAPNDSDASQTFFFPDSTLAQRPLAELLQGCRKLLEGSIPDDMELVAYFQKLGLTVSEDMSDVPDTTLATLLELYVLLEQRDDTDSHKPLYIELTTKFRYSPRLTYLYEAIEQGKGLKDVEVAEEIDYEASVDFETEDDYNENANPGEPQFEEEYGNIVEQAEAPFQGEAKADEYDEQSHEDETFSTEGVEKVNLLRETHSTVLSESAEAGEAHDASLPVQDGEDLVTDAGLTTAVLEIPHNVNVVNDRDDSVLHDEDLGSFEAGHSSAKPATQEIQSDDVVVDKQAFTSQIEDDLDDLDQDLVGEEEDFTNYSKDAFEESEVLFAEGIDETSVLKHGEVHPDHVNEYPLSAEENDFDEALVIHTGKDAPPLETEPSAHIHEAVLAQHSDLAEDELTFSEDELDGVQDQSDFQSNWQETRATAPTVETELPVSSPLSLTSRKRSFREQATDLNPGDGGEQKKPRPA